MINDILNKTDFTIVPLLPEHMSGYHRVLDSVARERKYIAFLEGPSIEGLTQYITKCDLENSPHYVAIFNNEVIGWCDITRNERPIFAHCGQLGLGIEKRYRGQGIGTALLQTAITAAFSLGLSRIELTVREHNPAALALYQRFGFTIEGIKRQGAYVDGAYEDIICMALLRTFINQ